MNKIYDLKLHQSIWDENYQKEIMRVPGGWIYSAYDKDNDKITSSVFVPFNNEFQEKWNYL